jgi:hypothetical protein
MSCIPRILTSCNWCDALTRTMDANPSPTLVGARKDMPSMCDTVWCGPPPYQANAPTAAPGCVPRRTQADYLPLRTRPGAGPCKQSACVRLGAHASRLLATVNCELHSSQFSVLSCKQSACVRLGAHASRLLARRLDKRHPLRESASSGLVCRCRHTQDYCLHPELPARAASRKCKQ